MPVKVRVASSDRCFDAAEGEDLLEVLQRNAYPIATSCGGVATCGLCRVVIVEGKERLSPIGPAEVHHLGNVAKIIGARLACQSQVRASEGDIVVDVPSVDDPEERKRRKAERARTERRPRDEPRPSQRSPAVPGAVIEWRPRKLGGSRP
jgi:ferredoxin